MLLLVLACSDYALNGKDSVAGAPPPDIAVSRPGIEAGIICGEVRETVMVQNEGETLLTVTEVTISGSGWSLEPVDLPFSLEPGASAALGLIGSEGSATLTIKSDDPDEPAISLPLSAVQSSPPTANILTPSQGDILAEGQDIAVEALVGDDLDAPESLQVQWSSGGVELSTDAASVDGSVGFPWPASDRTSGTAELKLTVTDSCGLSTTQTVQFCQDASITTDPLSLSSWHYEGSSRWDSSRELLELTSALEWQVGSAFETSNPVSGDAVSISFLFYIGDGTGADGLSLTALDSSRMTGFLGGTGCGIGYGGDADCTAGPALPGWTVVLDTYYNVGLDPVDADFLQFTFDGDVDEPALWVAVPEMEDNGWHSMEVVVQAPHVLVSIDSTIWIDQDFSGNFSFPAYVGFTAGTGSLTNQHLIDALEVTESVCEEE
jgi:hypothetical protein